MNFADEEYVRVYCKDTVTVQKIGWEGRLVLWELLRKVNRTTGELSLEQGDDEVESIAMLIRVPEQIVRVGLERLASRGVTSRHGSNLVIVKFVEAQTAKRSDRVRAKEYRDRARDEASRNPEKKHAPSQGVSDHHESSLLALPCLAPPSLALPCPAGEARGRAKPAAAPAPVSKVPTNWEQAMQVPLAERARSALEQPEAWSWAEPHRWPEVGAVASALARAAGQARPRLGDVRRDAGVRAVLGLFADGHAGDGVRGLQRLVELVERVGRSKWYRERGKGLSSLTAEVLRRAENEHADGGGPMDPEIAKELQRTRRMRAEISEGGG